MKRYEYQYIEVPKAKGLKAKTGDTFEACKQVITEEAAKGWRLKQILMPFTEQVGVYQPYCYQIVFERELS